MDDDATIPGLCCSICYNAFSSKEEDLIPRVLNCGHTYCSGCLKQIAAKCRISSICCPTCKTETPFSRSCFVNVANLPKNFGLLEIIEAQECQIESINIKKQKDRYLCADHDEPMKVFCHTDNCLVCIYCQVYGAHKGHKCDLASSLSESALKELNSISKTFAKYNGLLLNAKQRTIQRRQEIIEREDVVKANIKKHFRYLRSELCRLETTAKCSLDLMTKAKLTQVNSQLKVITDIMAKCEQVVTNVQGVETKGDSAIIQKHCDVRDLMTDISSVIDQCELKPLVKNNLEYSINHKLLYELDHAGEVIEDSECAEAQGQENNLKNSEFHVLSDLQKSLKQIAHHVGLSMPLTTKHTEEEKRLTVSTLVSEPSLETAKMPNHSLSFVGANVSSGTCYQETQEMAASLPCILDQRLHLVHAGRTLLVVEPNIEEIENWEENQTVEGAQENDGNETVEGAEGNDGNQTGEAAERDDENEFWEAAADNDGDEAEDEREEVDDDTEDGVSDEGDHVSDAVSAEDHSDEGYHASDAATTDDDSNDDNEDCDDGVDEVVDGAIGRLSYAANYKQQTDYNRRENLLALRFSEELRTRFTLLATVVGEEGNDGNQTGEVTEREDENEDGEATADNDGNEEEDEREEVGEDARENEDVSDAASADDDSDEGDHASDAATADDDSDENDDSDDGDDEVVDEAVGGMTNLSGTFHTCAANNKQQTSDNHREDCPIASKKGFKKIIPRGSSDDELPKFMANFNFRVNNDISCSRNSAFLNSSRDISAQLGPRSECSRRNCKYHAKAALKCLYCGRLFCRGCAQSSTCCKKGENGHSFSPFSSLTSRDNRGAAKNTIQKFRHYKKSIQGSPSNKFESNSLCASVAAAASELGAASPWQCMRCTMVNRAKCLVCEACETSRDFDPKNGKVVCPMCTLINDPGRRKCELCETDLQDRNSDSGSDLCSD